MTPAEWCIAARPENNFPNGKNAAAAAQGEPRRRVLAQERGVAGASAVLQRTLNAVETNTPTVETWVTLFQS